MNKPIGLPVNPAPPSQGYQGKGLDDNGFCRVIIACLLMRLGLDYTTFTQNDFNCAAGMILLEGADDDGINIGLGFPNRPAS